MADVEKQVDKLEKDVHEMYSSLDSRLDQATSDAIEIKVLLSTLCVEVATLTKIITTGNGQKPLTVQMAENNTNTQNNTKELEKIRTYLDNFEKTYGTKVSATARTEKWKTIGKIVGVISLAVPGIVSWVMSMM